MRKNKGTRRCKSNEPDKKESPSTISRNRLPFPVRRKWKKNHSYYKKPPAQGSQKKTFQFPLKMRRPPMAREFLSRKYSQEPHRRERITDWTAIIEVLLPEKKNKNRLRSHQRKSVGITESWWSKGGGRDLGIKRAGWHLRSPGKGRRPQIASRMAANKPENRRVSNIYYQIREA